MIQLTLDQRQELQGPGPTYAVDPQTNERYVLILAAEYTRVKALLAIDDCDPEVMYPLLADLSPDDWEDPAVYGFSR